MVPVSVGQVNSKIRSVFSKKLVKKIKNLVHKPVYQKYLTINPTVKPLDIAWTNPVLQQWVNRLRMGSDEWCYQHDTPNRCGYCADEFSAAHYLIGCPVTSSNDFLECLSEPDFCLPPDKKATIMLTQIL